MIFLDANFIISLYMEKHDKHERAVKIWNEIKDNNEEKVISNLIIPEVITVLNVKLKQDKELLQKVFYDMINNFIVIDDTDSYTNGFFKVLEYKKRLPLFDGIYMALMEDLKITKIITFDEHFKNRRFEIIQ